MIENADKIGTEGAVKGSRFQQDLLDHWRDIQQSRRFPDKRAFRPQKFPKFLPQLAIVSVNDHKEFDDRLTGAAVSEVLKLNSQDDRLVAAPDTSIRTLMLDILGRAIDAREPIYFKGRFRPDASSAIPFTALVLPFSHNGDEDILDTLMLAFDFSKEHRMELVHPSGEDKPQNF
ncbi:MAG: PAS domain-containing protein [Alphaproteobacteria bacterium]|nr:PAS domain-containing protein [Alphaproteobacteria bacterium]